MKQLTATMFGLLTALTTTAQHQMVVVSGESGVPVKNVLVYSDAGAADSSRWDGTVCVPDSFALLTLKHPKFETRRMTMEELADTVYLIPKMNALTEVVVLGRKPIMDSRKFMLSKVDAQLIAAKPDAGNMIDLVGLLLNKLSPYSRSEADIHKEKYQQMLNNY